MTGPLRQSVIADDKILNGGPSVRFMIILLLVVTLSGLDRLVSLATAAPPDNAFPIVRHRPLVRLALGETLPIRVSVETETGIKEVTLWYRAPGEQTFQAVPMTKKSGTVYEIGIVMTDLFKKGIEYYIEATDQFGNRGTDGAKSHPYFVGIIPEFGPETPVISRPWWKNPWIWSGLVLVIGGGAYAFKNDKKNQGTGTVVVQ